MDNTINSRDDIPKYITLGETVFCQKDPSKGNAVDNYRPIFCFPLMWKLMTGSIAENVYNFLMWMTTYQSKKRMQEKSRGTKDQLSIDKMILCDFRKRNTNLGIVWIDYKKAYEMVPCSWNSYKCLTTYFNS